MLTHSPFSQRAVWAAGQPISYLMQLALSRPELISLAAGFVDQATLPVEPTHEALQRVLADPARARAALQYGTTPGLPELREQILARQQAADSHPASEAHLSIDQVVMTAGSNQTAAPGRRYAARSGRHRALRRADLLRLPRHAGQFGGAVGRRGDRRRRDHSRGAGRGTCPTSSAAGELPRVKAIYVTTSSTTRQQRDPARPSGEDKSSRSPSAGRMTPTAFTSSRTPPTASCATAATICRACAGSIRRRRYRHRGRNVFQIVFARHSRRLGHSAARSGRADLPPEGEHRLRLAEFQSTPDGFGAQHRGLFEPHVASCARATAQKMQAMLAAADQFLAPLSGRALAAPDRRTVRLADAAGEVDAGPEGQLLDRAMSMACCMCRATIAIRPTASRRTAIRFG